MAFKTYEYVLTSNIDLITRMRIFRAYVTSVFLYNSELWTVNISQKAPEENAESKVAIQNKERHNI